jgi:hypothetical protein
MLDEQFHLLVVAWVLLPLTSALARWDLCARHEWCGIQTVSAISSIAADDDLADIQHASI